MEHFRNAKVVRLLSRHNKYLTADDDDEDGVRQHRSGASRGAKWEVELVDGRTDAIRLKSCFNRYLAASDKRFLLGATGKRVVLLPLPPKAQPQSLGKSVEWQPVPDGTKFVKLQTKAGTFLRANGFIKPYGNTVTHGNPHRTATQEWVFWEVDVVEMAPNSKTDPPPPPAVSNLVTQPYPCSAGAITPLRKKDQHPAPGGVWTGKVLADLASVSGAHSRRSSSGVSDVSASSCISQEEEDNSTPSPRSSVVSTPSSRSSAVDSAARPTRFRTSSTERDPVTAALQSSADTISTVSSTPASTPVTLTSPRRKIHSPPLSPPRKPSTPISPPPRKTSTPVSSPPRRMPTHGSPRRMPVLASQYSSWKEVAGGGRLIQYYFADDDGGVDDSFDSGAFEFHGVTVQELIHKVEEETDLDGFILCTRNVVNGRLCRLKLDVPLPPNRAPMTVFIVHPMSNVGKDIFQREAQSM